MARERIPFFKHLSKRQQITPAPCSAWTCQGRFGELVVLETGIGLDNASRAAQWLLSRPILNGEAIEPSLVIFAGFAGALADNLRVGDLLLADSIIDPYGTSWPAMRVSGVNPPVTFHRGAIFSSVAMIGDPLEKRRLGERYGAVAVDMESAAVARLCSERGLPFLCLRAISDDVNSPLAPQLVQLCEGGQVHGRGILSLLLRQPRLISQMLRLARNTSRAALELANGLDALLASR